MGRLCERPGCSEPAAVAYGMRPEDLVFWLDALHSEVPDDGGVLCQRHGDTMIVPRGWTLDDQRDPDLHLFRPPHDPDRSTSRRRRRHRSESSERIEQLELGGIGVASAHHDAHDGEDNAEPVPAAEAVGALGWKPAFDDGDDLDGLLSARSPLLSRAFRGADRAE